MERAACRRETAKCGEETHGENRRSMPAGGRATRARSNQQTAVFPKQRGFRCRRQPAGGVTIAAHQQLVRARAAPRDRAAANRFGCVNRTHLMVFVPGGTDPLRGRLQCCTIATSARAVRAASGLAMTFGRRRGQSLREHAAPGSDNCQNEAQHGKGRLG